MNGAATVGLAPSRIDRIRCCLSIERQLVGCALLRIAAAVVVLQYLLLHWPQRHLLWGPDSVYPLWLVHRERPRLGWPSLFVVESAPLFELLFLLTAAVAVLYALGWHTRWLALPFYVLSASLFMRNPAMLTGGDNLFLIQLPFLVLMNTSAYFSLDSGWRGLGDPYSPPVRPYVALLHNAAVIAVAAQVAIAYEFAGLFKIMGEPWQDGTAIYYALRRPEFSLPGVSPLLVINPVVVTLLTYGTVAFEISYPFLVLHRSTRWLGLLLSALFHIGIAVVMGLVVFAVEMLIFQLVLIDDAGYRAAWRAVRRRPGRSGQPSARSAPAA